MASDYGYITVANLEAYTAQDYSAVDARYTDAVIEASISQAERFVRAATDTTSSTDGIKSLVLEYSKYLMDRHLKTDHPEGQNPDPNLATFNELLTLLFPREQYSPVDSIPMQGIDR